MTKIKNKLHSLDVRPSKVKGQNFLFSEEALNAIVQFADPKEGEAIVEIGPGLGALTTKILERVSHISAIEVEPSFCVELREKFADRLSLFNQDIRTFDLQSLGEDLVIFGNLPYSLSTEIILHLITERAALKRGVFLLQKEFSERLGASVGTKAYGSLSVAVQLWCDTSLGPIVSGDSFHPPTKVQSRVIQLSFRNTPKVPVKDYVWFERVVRGAFHQRRKMLSNSLLSLGIAKEKIASALDEAHIDGKRRAETLTLEEFSQLADALA